MGDGAGAFAGGGGNEPGILGAVPIPGGPSLWLAIGGGKLGGLMPSAGMEAPGGSGGGGGPPAARNVAGGGIDRGGALNEPTVCASWRGGGVGPGGPRLRTAAALL